MRMATISNRWTLDELHRLPDDGNKYEIVQGVLFVTPPPSVGHEEIAALLGRILDRYVETHRLGRVYRPRAVIQTRDSEVEPDLMVRRVSRSEVWSEAPLPILVVEIASPSTQRRDRGDKRGFYVDLGVPEYWIVDGEDLSVRAIRGNASDVLVRDALEWRPAGAAEPLVIRLPDFFDEARSPTV